MRKPAKDLGVLDRLVARLRAPDGCPWDREQDFDDIRAYLLEEAHEVAAALDERDWEGLRDEIGDLLFQLAFLGRLSEEKGRAGLEESIQRVHGKMVDRHPHVFAQEQAGDSQDVAAAWERRKLEARGSGASLLAGVSASLPSLLAAYRMTQKAAGVGFDWSATEGVLDKIEEEIAELRTALAREPDRVAEEVGDLLFGVANLARHVGVDPESALARTNLKFRRRFAYMEQRLQERGRSLAEASLEDLEALWAEAKDATPQRP